MCCIDPSALTIEHERIAKVKGVSSKTVIKSRPQYRSRDTKVANSKASFAINRFRESRFITDQSAGLLFMTLSPGCTAAVFLSFTSSPLIYNINKLQCYEFKRIIRVAVAAITVGQGVFTPTLQPNDSYCFHLPI